MDKIGLEPITVICKITILTKLNYKPTKNRKNKIQTYVIDKN